MLLKPTFLKTDFRHQMLPIAFLPFLIWIGALIFLIAYWHFRWSMLVAVLLFVLGGRIAMKTMKLEYRVAAWSLPSPLKGLPGKDYLLITTENPAKVNKTTLFAEDGGYIFAEETGYRLLTFKHDLLIPFENFHHELIKIDGKVKSVLFRFQPKDSPTVMELAVSCKYPGDDMELAGSIPRRCEWGAKVIAEMRYQSPPPLPG
jgi:hypothetical protein